MHSFSFYTFRNYFFTILPHFSLAAPTIRSHNFFLVFSFWSHPFEKNEDKYDSTLWMVKTFLTNRLLHDFTIPFQTHFLTHCLLSRSIGNIFFIIYFLYCSLRARISSCVFHIQFFLVVNVCITSFLLRNLFSHIRSKNMQKYRVEICSLQTLL